MPTLTVFGKRLKAMRDARDWSQADLEAKSGVPAVMISHFETGVRQNASAATLVKLANALEVSIDYLLGRVDEAAPAGGQVGALLRTLGGASAKTIDAVVAIGNTLAAQDQAARDQRSTEAAPQKEPSDKRGRRR